MTVKLLRAGPAGNHGMIYAVSVGTLTLDVHVQLKPSGQWQARLVARNYGEASALAEGPSNAFSRACDLADPQWRLRGLHLPWSDIHNELHAQGAFSEEVSIRLVAQEAHALGIPLGNERLPTTEEAERGLRAHSYMRATYGLADDAPWRVVAIGREHDFYREVTIHVRLGASM